MRNKLVLSVLVYLMLVSSVLTIQLSASPDSQLPHLSPEESEVVTRINGTNVYNYDLELEKIGLNSNLSDYSFRSSGSLGGNETANWIERQFDSFGLETRLESFNFTTWNLLTQPVLVIDDDGNESTTDDQARIGSFQSEHYSWPTPEGGVFAGLVTLPLPEARNREDVGATPYNATAWLAVNTTGKVLLIGREVRWTESLHLTFRNKLMNQPPAAVIFTWSYDWMSWAPPYFPSAGGRPASDWGSYFWDLGIPVGWVSYEDGRWILDKEANNTSVSAHVTINAVIGSGPHYNVIGKLQGSSNSGKMILISGHYDTVTDSGFCDNGAGTAGVVELARVFSEAARETLYRPEHTIVFVAFAAEELGLVGAVNYMKQHEAELKDIDAVVNLDCIGSRTLEITETFPDDNGLNLKDMVVRSAEDLGVEVKIIDPGGSDHEAFRNPAWTNVEYQLFWGVPAGIGNFTRVKSSIMIDSYPLFYSDKWTDGLPGWIHTTYDSSGTLNWVTADRLESHVRVAGLSVMRFLSALVSPVSLQIITVTAIVGVVAAVLIYVERSRVGVFLGRAYVDVRSQVEGKQFVYIVVMTTIFLFLSFAAFTRMGKIEVITDRGFPEVLTMQYFGAPFNMFGEEFSTVPPSTEIGDSSGSPMPNVQTNTVVLWQGLLLDIAIYFSIAFLITYTAAKLRHRYARGKGFS